jgi:hypothetical protein
MSTIDLKDLFEQAINALRINKLIVTPEALEQLQKINLAVASVRDDLIALGIPQPVFDELLSVANSLLNIGGPS